MNGYLLLQLCLVLAPADSVCYSELLPWEALTGTWSGGYVGENTIDLEITLCFQSFLSGNALRYTRTAPEIDYQAETIIYRDPGSGEVLFLTLNNRGNVCTGQVSLDETMITLQGVEVLGDATQEIKTVLFLNGAGDLNDSFYRFEDGAWVQGHLQVFQREQGD